MTVRSLLGTYWSRSHFCISIKSPDTDPLYTYKQTIFTMGDYEVIVGSELEEAEIVLPIESWREIPTEVADMEVSEFGTIDEVLIIIVQLREKQED